MQKIVDFVEQVMGPFAEKIGNIKFLQALSETMQAIMAVTIVGAFACLFAFVDIAPWQAFLAAVPWVQVTFMTIQSLTLSIITLYVILVLPYRYGAMLGIKNPIVLSALNVAAFLMVTPTTLYTNIPSEWLGHKGMIGGMIVTWVTVRVYKFFIDNNISIKMPESVPEFVGASFTALLPGIAILFPLGFLGQLMAQTSWGSVHNVIYTLIQAPLSNVAGGYFGFLVYSIIGSLSFFCGIHGASTTAMFDPLLKAWSLEVNEAYIAGATSNLAFFNGPVATAFAGGQAITLGACLAVVLFAKSKRLKTVGRVSIVPQLFNISEPILFGLPIMLNPLFLVPHMLVCVVNVTIAYATCAMGLVQYTGLDPSWTIPMVIKAFFISNTPVMCAIVQIAIIVIDIAIFLPFIKIYDKQCLEEEAGEVEA